MARHLKDDMQDDREAFSVDAVEMVEAVGVTFKKKRFFCTCCGIDLFQGDIDLSILQLL